jgi:hypothetical protein
MKNQRTWKTNSVAGYEVCLPVGSVYSFGNKRRSIMCATHRTTVNVEVKDVRGNFLVRTLRVKLADLDKFYSAVSKAVW